MTTKTPITFSRRALLAIGLPAVAVKAARAQTVAASAAAYPNHQVTFIVPFAPAGGTDVLARLLAEKLDKGSASLLLSKIGPAPER